MANKVLFEKGVAHRVKSSKFSSRQAKKITEAIVALESQELNELIKKGKVKKLRIPNNENVYAYRAGMSERVVFSPSNGTNIVHDIIDVRGTQLGKPFKTK